MYRSEPPRPEPKGSWREIAQFSWIALSIVLPIVGLVVLVMLVAASFFVLLSIQPLLALIPVAVVAAGFVGFILIDRRNQRRLEDEIARGGTSRR
ncbi:MAG: hypothetical protein K1X87_11835 [Dehalococcoidia bacterium]|nr:hypothetical protein [Dehalococcoidia bacterium]